MAVSKRLRYEILRRDGHTCRYCGAKAPDVEITVDHVIPVALGGSDDASNLVAACRDCNGGKSSSHPDSPFVADVAEDAFRWSRVVRVAQSRMLAEMDARDSVRAQFAKRWDEWGYGSGEHRKTFPRPADWEQTVDQITRAGLPLRVLKDCVDLTMTSRHVSGTEKFRYMCGIAWKKIAEVQEAARAAWNEGIAADAWGEPDPVKLAAKRELAEELLDVMRERDSNWYLDEARAHLGVDDPEIHEVAARSAFYEAVRLRAALRQLLESLEDGDDWIAWAHEKLFDKHGLNFSHAALYSVAAQIGARASRNLPVGELVS